MVTPLNTEEKKAWSLIMNKRIYGHSSKYGREEGMVTYYELENIWSLL